MELNKINNLQKRYEDYDKQGRKYFYDIYYISPVTDGENVLKCKRGTGAGRFKEEIEGCIQDFNATEIIVKDFTGMAEKSRAINPTMNIRIKDDGKMAVYHSGKSKESDEIASLRKEIQALRESEYSNFSGFGSPEAYFSSQEKILNLGVDVRLLQETNRKLEVEIAKVTAENEDLQNELDEWIEKAENLDLQVTELAKYKPDNFQIAGFNGIHLLGKIGEKAITNLLAKNPHGASKILGISPDELNGFINPALPENNMSQAQAPALSPEQENHLKVATNIFDWLQSISSEQLAEVAEVFSFMANSRENSQAILNHVRQLNK